jgi:hypothetical protein
MTSQSDQLGFADLLASADKANHLRQLEQTTSHLPSTLEQALPFYRSLIDRHHTAMLAADENETLRLRDEARKLALRLNGGDRGILADADAPGRVLERETAARIDTPPLWGQSGDFWVSAGIMRVRIRTHGMFGVGMNWHFWPGFCAYAVDYEQPFLSETGYRSFLGIHADLVPDMTPETFARAILTSFVERNLHGRLVRIRREHYPKPRGEESICGGLG